MSSSKTSFRGPWCKNLTDFKKMADSTPKHYVDTLTSISHASGAAICDPESLHVWESEADLDSLVLLAIKINQVMGLHTMVHDSPQGRKQPIPAGMVIVAQDAPGSFWRICALAAHITKVQDAESHSKGNVKVFKTIAVVRGVDPFKKPNENGVYPGTQQADALAAVNCVSITIKKIAARTAKLTIVWHQGPIVHFLNTFIKHTDSSLRNKLKAVTIDSALHITASSIRPGESGKHNSLSDLNRLSTYLSKLDVFAVFLDNAPQQIPGSQHLNEIITSWGHYSTVLLPPSIWTQHFKLALDDLCVFLFRVFGAIEKKHTENIIRGIHRIFRDSSISEWAVNALKASTYTAEACKSVASTGSVQYHRYLADAPLKHLSATPTLNALSRYAVGPGLDTYHTHITAPLSIDFAALSLCISSSTPFRLLLASGTSADPALVKIKIEVQVWEVCRAVLGATQIMSGPDRSMQKAWIEFGEAVEGVLETRREKLLKRGGKGVLGVVEMLSGGSFGRMVMAGPEGRARKGR